jgi:polyhydroxybutyrate depolymerase
MPAALAAALCALSGAEPARAATGRVQIDVAGQKRDVLLIEFERLKRVSRTAIIVLRGGGPRVRNALTDRRGIGLSPVVRNSGVVIAYPEAVDATWSLGAKGPDDAAMVRALANKLVNDGLADRRRIFLAGVSSGGVLALKIACGGADYLAGVVAMNSAIPADTVANCKIGKPTPFMLMNGTANPLIPWQGGKANLETFKDPVVSAEETLKPFAEAAQCGADRNKQEMPDRDPADGSRVVIERLNGCKAPIELVRVDGGGHTLPGRPARGDRGVPVGARNNDISTPRVLWDFVRRAAK